MKEFYRIHELSGLFGLCPDTLRYYEEKGLLHPCLLYTSDAADE